MAVSVRTMQLRVSVAIGDLVGALLIDLSKAFDFILHDLLIPKLAAYGHSEEALIYILSYLSNCKQCVRINDTYSEFENII